MFAIFATTFLITKLAYSFEFRVQVVDEPLKPYVQEYYNLANHYCPQKKFNEVKHYVIELKDKLDDPSWIGVCDHKFNGYHVQISQEWWTTTNNSEQRRQLIFHELAHCVIDMEHSKSEYNYMYPYFNAMPRKQYTNQAIQDIVDYCFEGK